MDQIGSGSETGKNAGWNVSDPTQVVQEYDIVVNPSRIAEPETPYGGHQFSDYVLLGRDRKPLAVVEAKKTSKDAALDREQAKQYCYNTRQLEFLRLLKDFIIEREKVEKRDLIQSPFTIIHPQGIRGVFGPAEIDEILQLTEKLAA